MQLRKLAKRAWFRTTAVSVLALFTLAVGVQAATTLGVDFSVEDGLIYVNDLGDTQANAVYYSDQGLYGDAVGWSPNGLGTDGFWFEHGGDGSAESAGMYADDDTLVLWSPGDNYTLALYDEDDLPGGDPIFVIEDGDYFTGEGAPVGLGVTSPSVHLMVGSGSLDHLSGDGNGDYLGDVLISDELEVDGTAYFDSDVWFYTDVAIDSNSLIVGDDNSSYIDYSEDVYIDDDFEVGGDTHFVGNVYTHGPTTIGDGAIEAHTVTGIMTFNQNIIVNGDSTLGSDGADLVTINGNTGFTDDVTMSDGGVNAFFVLDQTSQYIELGDIVGGSGLIGIDWSLSEVYVEGADFFVDNIEINNGTAIDGHVSNTGTLDFASTASGACSELTITVVGAAANDTVTLGPPAAIEAGLTWSGFVSAADTVTVRVCNPTGGAIDPASATWRADMWSH